MKDYKKIYQSQFGKSLSTSDIDKQNKKVNNLKARLEQGGVDVEKAQDDRNWLEKALNLRQDQGLIKDLFEVINRPQQAIFSGIKSTQEGGSFGEGLKEGITGKDDTQFKDILMNTGKFNDREGKLDFVDVLGITGDVFLDPLDLALIPVTAGGSVAAKAATKVDNIADTTKAVSKSAKALDAVNDVEKTIKFKSVNNILGDYASKAIKKGANVTDTLIEKGLNKIDNTRGVFYKTPNAKWASELGKVGDGKALLEVYKGMKNNLTTMFDTALSKGARITKKFQDAKENILQRILRSNGDNISRLYKNYEGVLGKTSEEIAKDINKIIDVVDDISMDKVINNSFDNTIKYTDEIKNRLIDIANDVPDKTETLINGINKGKNGVLELSEDWLNEFNKFAGDKLSATVKRGSFYTNKELKTIEDITKFYQENAPELIEKTKEFYNYANGQVSEVFTAMKGLQKKYETNNIEGFSKHKLSDTYEANVKKLLEYGVDPKDIERQLPSFQGNGFSSGSKTLNARKYEMSAGEANILKKKELMSLPGISKEGKEFVKNNIDLFEDTATAGIQEYINQMPRLAKNTQIIDEVLMKQGFGDLEKIDNLKTQIRLGKNVEENTRALNTLLDNTPFRVVENGKAPYGFKKLDTDTKDYLVNFLKSMSDKTGTKELKKMAKQLNRLDNIAIDPTVLNILKINTDTTRKSEFLKLYDGLMNTFKGFKTASITNQLNNIGGNMTNMFLAGMNADDYAKYITKAINDINKYDEILTKGAVDLSSLSEKEQKIFNNLKSFQENVTLLDDTSILKKYDIDELAEKIVSKKGKKIYLGVIRDKFAQLNAKEDRIFKYATYLKGLDDPSFIKNLGIESVDNLGRKLSIEQMAGMATNKALFDAEDLTAFEKKVMKRLIPFYTFTKKNLTFQLDNVSNNLSRYKKLIKAYNSTTKSTLGDDYDNIADYLKENMYIPIPGSKDKDGNYKFIRSSLNIGDISDLTSEPLSSLLNKTSPIIKYPLELATNQNFFTGQPLENFKGEKGDINILNNIPILQRGNAQQALGDLFGLDVPLKQIDSVINGGLTKLFTINGNVDKDKINRSYEEIDELNEIMKQYEQKGYEFSTINELKKANKNNTISGIQTILDKYGIK